MRVNIFEQAMAVACELFDFQSVATFLPEDMQEAAEGVFDRAKQLNAMFEPCQIILGDCQDRECLCDRWVCCSCFCILNS